MLRENDIRPQRILVSAATRAIATVTMVTEAAGLEPVIQSSRVLYEKDAAGYLEELRSMDEEPGVVLLVAHNPSLEELLRLLTGLKERLPPAGLARLSLPLTRWSELDGTTPGELTGLWKPGGIGVPKP